jgi:hypothetical protein
MFAAYKSVDSEVSGPSKEVEEDQKDWLQVSSFQKVEVPEIKIQNEHKIYELIDESELPGIEFPSTSKDPGSTDIYYIDDKRKKEYLEWNTLPNRVLPKYHRKFKSFAKFLNNRNSKMKFKRYFKEREILKSIVKTESSEERNEKLKNYQSHLAENTKDVEQWLEYYHFQVKFD